MARAGSVRFVTSSDISSAAAGIATKRGAEKKKEKVARHQFSSTRRLPLTPGGGAGKLGSTTTESTTAVEFDQVTRAGAKLSVSTDFVTHRGETVSSATLKPSPRRKRDGQEKREKEKETAKGCGSSPLHPVPQTGRPSLRPRHSRPARIFASRRLYRPAGALSTPTSSQPTVAFFVFFFFSRRPFPLKPVEFTTAAICPAQFQEKLRWR